VSTSTDDDPMFDERITEFPWGLGILAGAWTFISSYVVMGIVIVTYSFATVDNYLDGFLDNTGTVLRDVAVVLYNAHHVDLDVVIVEQIVNPGELPDRVNRLAGETTLPTEVYYAVPILVLLLAGALVARRTLSADADVSEAALPPAAMAVGYTATAVLGTFLVRQERFEGTVELVPNLPRTLAFGTAYGLGFTLVGALLVVAYWNRDEIERRISE
jgi:hypothetical protein